MTSPKFSNPENEASYNLLMEKVKLGLYGKKITITSANSVDFVYTNEIICFTAEGSYITLHLTSGKKIVCAKSLKYFESTFELEHFFRANKSHLVNMKMVVQYKKTIGNGQLILSNGDLIAVSRRRKSELRNFLGTM